MVISIIAAMDTNKLIGKCGHLPWKLPADMKHFRELTLEKPVIMGRRTFDSIGKPLANRTNIILTHDREYRVKGCVIVHTVDEALTQVRNHEETMIIGGSSIYKQFLQCANRFYLTQIHDSFDGDTYFPPFNPRDWQQISRLNFKPDKSNPHAYSFISLQRQAG